MKLSKENALLLVLVVISCQSSTTSIRAASLPAGSGSGAGGDGQSSSNAGDKERTQEQAAERMFLKADNFVPRFEQLARVATPTGSRSLIDRDDDHRWNVELLTADGRAAGLPNLAQYGHELSPVYITRLLAGQQKHLQDESNNNNLFAYANELLEASKQLEKRRNIRALQRDEDKDYSFVVGLPNGGNQEIMFSNRFYIPRQRQQQSPKWTAPGQRLRDLRMPPVESSARQSYPPLNSNNANGNYPDNNAPYQLSQQFGENPQINSLANELVVSMADGEPKNREKRRRCKMDPNLGVKNPSFCDTDAYFGAADYSMRDVWDSAGRKR